MSRRNETPSERRQRWKREREAKKRNNPYLYWYGVNRRNANRRAIKNNTGKFWYVSFEHYVWICDTTGYLALKGRGKYDASLDCIEDEKGYVDGNIRVITVSDNSKKGKKYVAWNWITKEWEIVTGPIVPKTEGDDPF
jgi:hypothetical protein